MKKIGNKSALLAAIESLHDSKIRDGEFTLKDFMDAAEEHRGKLSRKAASDHLQRLIDNGSLKMRKVCLNGTITNVYSDK